MKPAPSPVLNLPALRPKSAKPLSESSRTSSNRSSPHGEVEESRQPQAAPYLSIVYPLAAALLDRAVAMQGTLGFFTGTMHIPAPLAFLAICAEFFGAMGLIIGFLTRIAVFGIATNMVVAIATVHHDFGFFMNWNGTQKGEGFEFHLLALAIAAFLMIRGAGAFSVDHALSTKAPSYGGARSGLKQA